MSLYTKYRPKDWDSVIGQNAISHILRNSLRQERVGHAYILTGSRGTGKTTSARILAKGVNCLNLQDGNPCHICAHCVAFDNGSFLDVIEIDGASNNGVENVRELIEKARFEPSQGKFKIYIIDEVHMLSSGAFNALLKTLEEPPAHVKFILATTEIDKVPETIRSRALEFDFKKITETDIIARLEFVTKAEGIKAEKEALSIIAKAARGGLRDALTLLEQNAINAEVSTEYVRSTLSLLEESLIENIIDALYHEDKERLLLLIDTLRARHVRVRSFFDQMLYTLRDKLFQSLEHADFGIYEPIFAIFEKGYASIKSIPDGFLLIEITLLRAVNRGNEKISPAPKKETDTKPIPKEEASKKQPKVEETPKAEKAPPKIEEPQTTEQPEEKIEQTISFSYPKFLQALKEKKPALVAELKMARFKHEGTHLTLIFSKKWNFDRISSIAMKNLLLEVVQSIYPGTWTLTTELQESGNPSAIVDEVF